MNVHLAQAKVASTTLIGLDTVLLAHWLLTLTTLTTLTLLVTDATSYFIYFVTCDRE